MGSDSWSELLRILGNSIRETQKGIHEAAVGRRVRILSNYNGQPIGRSRPSLKGKVFHVTHAFWSDNNGVCLFIEDYGVSIPLNEVEFVDP